jgi:hypothetical protein
MDVADMKKKPRSAGGSTAPPMSGPGPAPELLKHPVFSDPPLNSIQKNKARLTIKIARVSTGRGYSAAARDAPVARSLAGVDMASLPFALSRGMRRSRIFSTRQTIHDSIVTIPDRESNGRPHERLRCRCASKEIERAGGRASFPLPINRN